MALFVNHPSHTNKMGNLEIYSSSNSIYYYYYFKSIGRPTPVDSGWHRKLEKGKNS